MAGRNSGSASGGCRGRGRGRERGALFVFVSLLTLTLFFLFFFFFSSSPISPTLSNYPNPNPNLKHSFVSSLERFLATNPPPHHLPLDNPGDEYHSFHDSPLRVYVYDMPHKFTYDLLRLFLSTFRDTSNLTSNGSPLHRLILQHSVDYWLWSDLIAPPSTRLLTSLVVRVHDQAQADLYYIPFFTTISYFLLEKQHCKSLYRV